MLRIIALLWLLFILGSWPVVWPEGAIFMPSPCIVRNAATDGFDERYNRRRMNRLRSLSPNNRQPFHNPVR